MNKPIQDPFAARELIRRLTSPDDPHALHFSFVGEDRLRVLLYVLRHAGFAASGIRATVVFNGSVAFQGRRPYDTDVHAIAIRTGPVSEIFALHKKAKVSIEQEEDLSVQLQASVRHLASVRADPTVKSLSWGEIYPEPMKQKDLYGEIVTATGDPREFLDKLLVIAEAWKLDYQTAPTEQRTIRPRL